MSYFKKTIHDLLDDWVGPAVLTPGDVGIEVECEGRNLPVHMEPGSFWVSKEDHSLRNNGREYVLAKPIVFKDVQKAVESLSKALKADRRTVVEQNHRTSVHVHLNVQRLLVQEVYSLITLYFLFEELLVSYSGPDRVGNMYCLRGCDAEFLPLTITKSILDGTYFRSLAGDDIRYSSLNLKAIYQFGSIEFRSFKGSVDPKEIITWVKILENLFKKALEFNSPRAIIQVYEELNPVGFVNKIWGEQQEFLEFIFSQPNFQASMFNGYLYSFEIAHAAKERHGWIDKFRFFEEQAQSSAQNPKSFRGKKKVLPEENFIINDGNIPLNQEAAEQEAADAAARMIMAGNAQPGRLANPLGWGPPPLWAAPQPFPEPAAQLAPRRRRPGPAPVQFLPDNLDEDNFGEDQP